VTLGLTTRIIRHSLPFENELEILFLIFLFIIIICGVIHYWAPPMIFKLVLAQKIEVGCRRVKQVVERFEILVLHIKLSTNSLDIFRDEWQVLVVQVGE